MTRQFFVMFLLAGLFLGQDALHATVIQDDEGHTYQGVVLDEDSKSIYLDIPSGVITMEKTKILTMDGKPYSAPALAAPSSAVTSFSQSAVSFTESPDPSWVVRVGPGGLTRQELSVYQRGLNNAERFKNISGEIWGTQDVQIRHAIEDEIVFQEALREGYHVKGHFRDSIIGLYRANQTLGDIHPQLFSENDMKAFYRDHRADWQYPAEYVFSVAVIGGTASAITRAYEKIKDDPETYDQWKRGGWHKRGDSFRLPLSPSGEEAIYSLRGGDLSQPIYEGGGMGAFNRGNAFVFWCHDYKAPVQMTFEQAKEKVRHRMIRAREKTNQDMLTGRLNREAPGKKTDDALFDEALRAQVHRDRQVRDGIINAYLQEKQKTLGQVARDTKNRYPVTFL